MIIGSEVKELRGRGVEGLVPALGSSGGGRAAVGPVVAIVSSSPCPSLKLGSYGCQAFTVLVRVGSLKQRI